MISAIEATGLSLSFGFEESLCVDPYVHRLPILLGDLELVGIATLHRFCALQVDAGALGGVIHQQTVEVGLHGGLLYLVRSIGLHFHAIEKWAQLPAVGAV